jgi:hypothetical protein
MLLTLSCQPGLFLHEGAADRVGLAIKIVGPRDMVGHDPGRPFAVAGGNRADDLLVFFQRHALFAADGHKLTLEARRRALP